MDVESQLHGGAEELDWPEEMNTLVTLIVELRKTFDFEETLTPRG